MSVILPLYSPCAKKKNQEPIVALKNQIEFLQIQLESKDLANKELSKF